MISNADQNPSGRHTAVRRWLESASPSFFSAYCIAAAFSTYFCMYAFRKPFTAGEYADTEFWGLGYKSVLIAAQVAGYTLSKFVGVKVVAEMSRSRRAMTLMILIAIAEAALLAFAVVPPPYNALLLFVNGLPLGMVFGLVLSFLEGRRLTETLAAGLCASFIVSSGFVKSIGRSLIVDAGVSDYWMPALTGLLFVPPLLVSVWLLSQIPPPTEADITSRTERTPMDGAARWAFYKRHALGLTALIGIYVALTVLRSLRDDFAVEIWSELGHNDEPQVFAWSETLVMFAVVTISGMAIWVRSNRLALLSALGLISLGFALILGSLAGLSAGALGPFGFMVLLGVGTYVPYLAFHTTVFERLIATFRERANVGYLMYLADSIGYLGYIGVMVFRAWFTTGDGLLGLFLAAAWWIGACGTGLGLLLLGYYAVKSRGEQADEDTSPAPSLSGDEVPVRVS